MSNYQKFTISDYWIEELIYKCKKCANEMVDYVSLDSYELVDFENRTGEVYFLPTFGKYGYIELLKKLVPTWQSTDEITFKVAKAFEKEFNKITPFELSFHYREKEKKCNVCGCKEVKCIKTNYLHNPNINWVEIDIDKLEKL